MKRPSNCAKACRERISHHNLQQAYQLLDPNQTGLFSRETMMAVFCILNKDFSGFSRISADDTELLFAALDKDGSSTITL